MIITISQLEMAARAAYENANTILDQFPEFQSSKGIVNWDNENEECKQCWRSNILAAIDTLEPVTCPTPKPRPTDCFIKADGVCPDRGPFINSNGDLKELP